MKTFHIWLSLYTVILIIFTVQVSAQHVNSVMVTGLGIPANGLGIPANGLGIPANGLGVGTHVLEQHVSRFPSAAVRPTVDAVLAGSDSEDILVGFPNPNEVREIDTDIEIDGNIIVVNNGKLRFNGNNVRLAGNIHIFQNGGVEFHDAQLGFAATYRYQRSITLVNKASLWFQGSSIGLSGFNIGCNMTDTSVFRNDGTSVSGGVITSTLDAMASYTANYGENLGEILFFGESTGDFDNCTGLLTWLTAPSGSRIDMTFPGRNLPGKFVFPDSARIGTGVGYKLSYNECLGLLWGIIHEADSEILLTDSDILAVGAMFRSPVKTTVSGLTNDVTLDSYRFPSDDRDVRFERCKVTTWNLYGLDQGSLEINSSIFGEVLAFGESEVVVNNSICDGKGGFVGSVDRASLTLVQTQIIPEVLVRGRSQTILVFCSVPSAKLTAVDNGSMLIAHSTIPSLPVVGPGAAALVASIDEPIEAKTNSLVPVFGTVRFLHGDEVPVFLSSWWLDAFPFDDPEDIKAVTPPSIIERYRDTLGVWDTNSLLPGTYALNINMRLSTGDTISIPRSVLLTQGPLAVEATSQPRQFTLGPSYPNPVSKDHAQVVIDYRLAESDLGRQFTLSVYDVLGNEVRRLPVPALETGRIQLDLSGLTPGVYIYTLRSGLEMVQRKMIIGGR